MTKRNAMIIIKGLSLAYLFTIFLCFSKPLFANDSNIKFNHISINEGLSQNSVFCILQDKKGFLWFGTEDGLNLYNGYDIKIFSNDPTSPIALGDNFIQSLCEDDEGNIWIGTISGGLNRLDPTTLKIINFQADSLQGHYISNNFITTIFKTRQGDIWAGTMGGGLNRYDKRTGKFICYKNNPNSSNSLSDNNVLAIHEDALGKLWIGTRNGLSIYDPQNNEFTSYDQIQGLKSTLTNNSVFAILTDYYGLIWIGTSDGLYTYNPKNGEVVIYKNKYGQLNSISHNKITSLYQDKLKRIWVGTENGLNLFNPKVNNFTKFKYDDKNPSSINNNHILAIIEERSGTMWIGTQGGGLNWFESKPRGFKTFRNIPSNPASLSENNVRSFFEDKTTGQILVGTILGGLNIFNREEKTFRTFKHNPNNLNSIASNRVNAILRDRSGVLWIGTGNGLDIFDINKGTFTHIKHNPSNPYSISDNDIKTLYEDSKGVLWIGTENGGLNRFDRATNRFYSYQYRENDCKSISHNRVRSIFEDSRGVFWVGTLNGVNVLNQQTEQFTRYLHDSNDTTSIALGLTMSIYEDKCKRLWFTTFNGINLYDRDNNKFIRYTTKQGLPNNVVYGMVEDDKGNLWMSTNNGISRFTPSNGKFRNYNVNDGLQGNEFNYGAYLKSISGEIYFGGVNGFNTFHPDSIRDNTYKPPIVLTDFKLVNKTVSVGKEFNGRVILTNSIDETEVIHLYRGDYAITFEYAALHYVSPHNNKYFYILEGLEDTWNDVGNRRVATFTTLPPNTYTFRVKAYNSDGVWSETAKSITIIVHPSFWETWWFRLFVTFIIALIIFGWYRNRVRRIEEQKRVLEQTVLERTNDLAEVNTQLEEQQAELEIRQEELSAQTDLLEQANKELHILNNTKDKFFNIIAHDLKNPFNSILGFSELLIEKISNDEKEKSLSFSKFLYQTSKSAYELLENLLTWSRSQSGVLQFNPENINLKKVLDYNVLMLTGSAQIKGIGIKSNLQSNIFVYADYNMLLTILRNLITNAIKFSKEGDSITLDVIEKDDSITVKVIDTGVGIKSEDLNKLFRLDENLKTEGTANETGTGLGLILCKEFVEKNNGTIWVESVLGKGSSFSFTLQKGKAV